jgi:hypothetical protein
VAIPAGIRLPNLNTDNLFLFVSADRQARKMHRYLSYTADSESEHFAPVIGADDYADSGCRTDRSTEQPSDNRKSGRSWRVPATRGGRADFGFFCTCR